LSDLAIGGDKVEAKTIGDLLWVWSPIIHDAEGNVVPISVTQPTAANFVEADSVQKAELLNVNNVILAGHGLPADLEKANEITRSDAGKGRIVWEIASDDGMHKPPFSYEKTIEHFAQVVKEYPQVEGVFLDDMSSMSMDAGFGAEHLRAIRQQLPQSVKLWGAVYTMNFERPGMDSIIEGLDVISLWVWHARDLEKLEKDVATLEAKFPDKPITLGLYLYDYGEARPMPRDLLAKQAELALKLAHEGRIEGIIFLTINNDAEAVQWTMEWIQKVKGQNIGE
jgi:hypothetical protein